MARHHGSLLVDANIILEAHRIGAWAALTGGYPVETVEDCVTETQTGFQRRRSEQQIDAKSLRASLRAVHAPGDPEIAAAIVRAPDIALDIGERSLWAHALTRTGDWILCGSNRASLRFGVRLGHRDRLVSLEQLLDEAGHRLEESLNLAYTSKWLEKILGELVLSEGVGQA